MTLKRIKDMLLDVVFPPICPVCNRIVGAGRHICPECMKKLYYVEEPYCMKCGKPVDEEDEFCRDCRSTHHVYDEGRAALLYDEYMSRSIYRFKYNGKQEFAGVYADIMYERLSSKIRAWNADVIIPVPVHKSRLKKRGYNQAALIAQKLSKLLKIPVREDIVTRHTATKVQKNLGARTRQNNLKKAFNITSNSVEYNSVLIVDDIYTTGATVDALAGCLKRAGIKKVYFATLCIGRGN